MKQQEALDLIQEFLKTHGMDGSGPEDDATAEELSDEGKGEDLFAGGDTGLAFRFFPQNGVLKCYALIYQFADKPRSGVLEACQDEAQKKTAKMGGGELEYDAEDQGLYLTRSYSRPVSVKQLTQDMEELMAASEFWGEDVLDRIASSVFHPEELHN